MEQTPAHERHNADLLGVMPPRSMRVIEVGCSVGALAREFKRINPACDYLGIDIDPNYVERARLHCDETLATDIEAEEDEFYVRQGDRDLWVFGDTLEHLRDPWGVLRHIRANIGADGCVVACVPNAQHWSVIARLALGAFRYEPSGLLDRTHLRWFTRQTLTELFESTGFGRVEAWARTFPEPNRDALLPAIGALAQAAGGDPSVSAADSIPLQYVVRARPS